MTRLAVILPAMLVLTVLAASCGAVTYYYGFEDGTLQGWTVDVLHHEGLEWHLTPSTYISHTGIWSLEYYMENYSDAMHLWIERSFPVPPTPEGYEVTLSWSLASHDYGDVNLWEVIASVSYSDPEVHWDFTSIGDTWNGDVYGYVWLAKQYSHQLFLEQPMVMPSSTDEIWVALGIWGTWETPRTYYVDDVYVHILPSNPQNVTIGQARSLPDGRAVRITSAYATSATSDLDGRIYIEDPNRSCGIAVETYPTTPAISRNSAVTVVGVLATVDGERVVSVSDASAGSEAKEIEPLFMLNGNAGGSDFGSYTGGVAGSQGLNNIGMLVRTCGKVVYLGSEYFVIDDGSRNAICGKCSVKGLAVSTTGLVDGGTIPMPPDPSYVTVTGISSVFYDNASDLYYPMIRPRDEDDVVVLGVSGISFPKLTAGPLKHRRFNLQHRLLPRFVEPPTGMLPLARMLHQLGVAGLRSRNDPTLRTCSTRHRSLGR